VAEVGGGGKERRERGERKWGQNSTRQYHESFAYIYYHRQEKRGSLNRKSTAL